MYCFWLQNVFGNLPPKELAVLFWLSAWFTERVGGAKKEENGRKGEWKRQKGREVEVNLDCSCFQILLLLIQCDVPGVWRTESYLDERMRSFVSALLLLLISYQYAVVVMFVVMFVLLLSYMGSTAAFCSTMCNYSQSQLHRGVCETRRFVSWCFWFV